MFKMMRIKIVGTIWEHLLTIAKQHYTFALLNSKIKLMKQISNNIRALRIKKGLSQQQVANKLCISVSGYGKIERGERGLESQRLYKLAQIFGVLPNEIFNACTNNSQKENKEAENINEKILILFRDVIVDLLVHKYNVIMQNYPEYPNPYEEYLYYFKDFDEMALSKEEYESAGAIFTHQKSEDYYFAFKEMLKDSYIYSLFLYGLVADANYGTSFQYNWERYKKEFENFSESYTVTKISPEIITEYLNKLPHYEVLELDSLEE